MSAAVIQTEFFFMTPADHFGPYVDVLYMNEMDAKAQINQNPFGILQENLDPVDAERLHQGFKAVDINTVILSQEQVNELELIQIRNAVIGPAITSTDMYGKEVHYEYDGIGAVSITTDPNTVTRPFHEREYFLDIVYTDGRVLRINSKKFNYNYLGQRITQHSTTNFLMLVEDLNNGLGDIYKDDGFNKTLNKNLEDINGFRHILPLKRYLRWLSHLHLIGFSTNSAVADGSRAPRESVFSKIRDEEDKPKQEQTEVEFTQKAPRPSVFAKKEETQAPVLKPKTEQPVLKPKEEPANIHTSIFKKPDAAPQGNEEETQAPVLKPKTEQPVLKPKEEPANIHTSIFKKPDAAPQGNEEETQKAVRPSVFDKKEEAKAPVLKPKEEPANIHTSIFKKPDAAPQGNEEETQKAVRPSVFDKKEQAKAPVLKPKEEPANIHTSIFKKPHAAPQGNEEETQKAVRPSVFDKKEQAKAPVLKPKEEPANIHTSIFKKPDAAPQGNEEETQKAVRPSVFDKKEETVQPPERDPNSPPVLQVKREKLGHENTARPSVFGSSGSANENNSQNKPRESVFGGNKEGGLFGSAKESSSPKTSGSPLAKRIRGAHKALTGGKDPEMVVSSMIQKGVPRNEARTIVEVLWKLYEMNEVMGINAQNGTAILNKMNVAQKDHILYLQIFNVKESDLDKKKKGWFKK